MEHFDEDYVRGFRFNYKNGNLSKSQPLYLDDINEIDECKGNEDEVPLFVFCRSCDIFMDYDGAKNGLIFDSWWKCPGCGKRVKEATVYNKLEKENDAFLHLFDDEDL